MTTQPRQAPTAQPMFCSIDDLEERLPPRGRRARRGPACPAPRFRPSFATPSRSRRPAAEPGQRREHRGAARRRTPGRPRPRTRGRARSRSPGGPTRPVVGRDDVLDLVGQQRRRVDLARVAAPNSSVTWRPSRIASSARSRTPAIPRPPAIEQQVAAPRSTSNGRPSGPSMSIVSPGRSRVNHSVPRPIVRKWIVIDAGRGVGGVDRERPAQDEPGVVAGPDVDELAGPRSRSRAPARGSDCSHWPGRISPALEELRGDEPHRHGGVRARVTPAQPFFVALVVVVVIIVVVVVVAVVVVRRRRPSSQLGRRPTGRPRRAASARSPKTSVGS